MSIQVKNGTPVEGPPLCETCTNAHIERGYKQTEVAMFCGANYPMHRVRFPVRDCTSYASKNRQVLEEMERIAWVLSPRGPKRTAGFVVPGKSLTEADDAADGPEIVELPLNRE